MGVSVPSCHPTRPYYAKGLCRSCYHKDLRRRHAERDGRTLRRSGLTAAERAEAQRRWDRTATLKRKGITEDQYGDLLTAQGGVCAICGGTKTSPSRRRQYLDIDHDKTHCPGSRSCGQCIRGLLCSSCNRGIGFFEDDPDRLRSAIAYIETASRKETARAS